MLLSASICLSTLQKHEGGFVLILKSTWGVLSTLYFWAWGVLSAFKKTCGGFCPPITKWTWGVLSVGCFVLHSHKSACSITGEGYKLEMLDLRGGGIVLSV